MKRSTPLRARKPMRKRRPTPRPHLHADHAYLAFLRALPCRAPGTQLHPGGDAHHLRHAATGASMGAHVKDDCRAISLCRGHHRDVELGQGPWKGWSRADIKEWESEQASAQWAYFLKVVPF